jgi:N-acetylneuraminic acid mutarotase
MIKKFFTIAVISYGSFGLSQDLWIQKDSLNGPPRSDATSFTLGYDGYVVSGLTSAGRKKSMVSYDQIQDDWDNELSLGGSTGDGLNRSSAMSFQAYGFGFVCMGEGDGFLFSDLWLYDPTLQTWTQMADFPGTKRTQGVGFDIDNIGYIGLGKADDLSTLLKDFWAYDYMSNQWSQLSDFPGSARLDAIGGRMGGKAYVGLGRDDISFPIDFYEYSPIDDSWIQKANFPGTPRANSASVAKFPQFYLFTGDDGVSYLNDTWEYNYFGDSWSQRTDFPGGPRAGCISLEIQGRYYVGAGFGNGIYYDDFYEYTFVLGNQENDILEISVFPNPSTGKFTVKLGNSVNNAEIKIFNSLGEQIYNTVAFSNSLNINLRNSFIQAGNYFIVIESDDKIIQTQQISLLDK